MGAVVSRINLTDSPELIKKKISKARTDSTLGISYSRDERPEVSNLVILHLNYTQD